MADEEPAEVLFRTSKRRKVTRKPLHSARSDQTTSTVADRAGTDETFDNEDEGSARIMRAQDKSKMKRYGIGFSNSESRRPTDTEDAYGQALVPVTLNSVSDTTPGSDRFVKPTGKVEVAEDKHMYVDVPTGRIRKVPH